MVERAVFLDRDGTMARDVNYCSSPDDFELFPETPKAVKALKEHGFKVIVITNQSGIARGYFTEETLHRIHDKMLAELAQAGAHIDGIYYCPHHPDDNCQCRKPKPELALRAAKDFNIDLSSSFVVGDLEMDIGLGKAIGSRTVLLSQQLRSSNNSLPDHITTDLYQAALWIINSVAGL
jgi:histidinol-phosphate phosphatase family protein